MYNLLNIAVFFVDNHKLRNGWKSSASALRKECIQQNIHIYTKEKTHHIQCFALILYQVTGLEMRSVYRHAGADIWIEIMTLLCTNKITALLVRLGCIEYALSVHFGFLLF